MNYLVIVLKYENQQNEVVKLNVFALIISFKKKKKRNGIVAMALPQLPKKIYNIFTIDTAIGLT